MKRVFTDRSRIESYQRCKRLRFHEYHEGESRLGIVTIKKPMPLAVGGSVHVGLASLLKMSLNIPWDELWRAKAEDVAVTNALNDFAQFGPGGLQVDTSEQVAMGDLKSLEAQLMQSLGETVKDEQIERMAQLREASINAFDSYLYQEQSALVEGLVRAYARRRLKPLLEEYEVLEIEREGQWLLWEDSYVEQETRVPIERQIWFMSRPDALLLERSSRNLYILSYKTAAAWDIRKDRDALRDMQGLSEGVEVERRLARWWQKIKAEKECGPSAGLTTADMSPAMAEYLVGLKAPPRIMGIRYEYLLKGERWIDKDLSEEFGLNVRIQRSPLTRAYLNAGMAAGDEQWNVSWDYMKETGETSKLYWKSWRGTPIFRHIKTKTWIDMLDQSVETIGPESRSLGWSSKAQATGFLAKDPLEELFIPPITVYRNDDELRDWIQQVEAQEREVAEHVELVHAASDPGRKRELLNVYFPQHRRACEYPTTCPYAATPTSPGPCFGSDEAFTNPLGTGKYKIREPHHEPEKANGIAKSSRA